MQVLLAAWLAAALALAVPAPAAATPGWSDHPGTLHVSGAAQAPGDGSMASPFPRIAQAVAVAVAGDTVLVGPGRYAEELRTVRPGRPAAPIRIVGRPGAHLVGPHGRARGRLIQVLHDHLTLGGFLGFTLLLVPVGWAWMSFAYYSDQFDTDDTLFQVVMLVAMLASAALAVNVGGALQGSPSGFVISNVLLRALLIGLYAWAWRNSAEARPMSARYAAGFSIGALIWLASLLTPEPLDYGLWALALLIEMGNPVLGYALARYRDTSRTCPSASACSP